MEGFVIRRIRLVLSSLDVDMRTPTSVTGAPGLTHIDLTRSPHSYSGAPTSASAVVMVVVMVPVGRPLFVIVVLVV